MLSATETLTPCAAVLDTGLAWQPYPEEFRAELVVAESVVGGEGFDHHGHGTRVAACLAGGLSGVCPNAKLRAYRCLLPSDSVITPMAACDAIYRAVEAGVDVINCSFAMRIRDGGLARACREARDKGILVMAARPSWASCWPADLDCVIAVGSHAGMVDVALPDCDRQLCGKVSVRGVSYVTAEASGLMLRQIGIAKAAKPMFSLESFLESTLIRLRQHYALRRDGRGYAVGSEF